MNARCVKICDSPLEEPTSLCPTLRMSSKYLIAGRNLSCISQQKNAVVSGVRLPSGFPLERKTQSIITVINTTTLGPIVVFCCCRFSVVKL